MDTLHSMASAELFHGEFRIFLKPDGEIIVPDLAEPLIPALRQLGAPDSLWEKRPCIVSNPRHLQAKLSRIGLTAKELATADEASLWHLHADAVHNVGIACGTGVSLLDLKIELAHRLMLSCEICERRCGVNRMAGETSFCGLAAGLQVGAYAMLYNEGPFVGAPSFSVFLRGCSLRCAYCYRPNELQAVGRRETDSAEIAMLLDQAARSGAKSWHFLGGNPDESLYGILQVLSSTTETLPVIWNSALTLTPLALALLEGVIDIYLPDFKFGNDLCAERISKTSNYIGVVKRNLDSLLCQGVTVVVRHLPLPGHELCCTEPVLALLAKEFPSFPVHVLQLFDPKSRLGY